MPKVSVWCRAVVAVGCCVGSVAMAGEAQAQEPEQVTPDKPPSRSVYTRDGLLGPVRVGPTVGMGAPDGMRFGLFATWKGFASGGGALSLVPTVGIPGAAPAQVSRFTGEGFVRVHPFRGAFYMGVAGGVAKTDGTTSGLAVAGVPESKVSLHAQTNVMYVAPHLGLRFMMPFGMTIGCDAGVEIPVVPGTPEFDAQAQGRSIDDVPGKRKVQSALRFASHTAIPVVHLLEVGYAF